MAYNGVSIVDYLKSVGVDSSFANRKKIAERAGIKNYTGTASQNTGLLKDMRSGKITTSGAPKATTPAATTPATTTTTTTSSKPTLTPEQQQAEVMLNDPRQTLDSIIAQIQAAVGTAKDNYVRPDLIDTIDPTMLDVNAMSEMLGMDFTYDRGEIEAILQGAVDAEYDLRGAEQGIAEKKFGQNMAVAQNTALDTLRQQQGQAVAQGATTGAKAANELSAVLGISQQAAEEATQLAMDRQLMAKEQGAARAQATSQALAQSNEAYLNYGGLARQYYNDQIQQLAAELAYNQAINTDYAGYEANRYSADQSLLAAIQQSGSNVYGNNQSTLGGLQQAIEQAQAQRYAADQQLEAQRIAANANIEAARIAAAQAAANAASWNSSGGSGGSGGGGGGGKKDEDVVEVPKRAPNPTPTYDPKTGAARPLTYENFQASKGVTPAPAGLTSLQLAQRNIPGTTQFLSGLNSAIGPYVQQAQKSTTTSNPKSTAQQSFLKTPVSETLKKALTKENLRKPIFGK